MSELTDREMLECEEKWEARKAELRQQYPDIAGEFKVFDAFVITEHGCNPREGEFSVGVSGIINGWVSKGDVDLIYEAVWNDLESLDLPEEGTTGFIAYESGERDDVFWNKFYRIVRAAATIGREGE
jgi:hypothetical protein